ncbi:hypothetical protein ACWCW7_10505 [Nocardia tengchongensis]
MSVYTDLVCTQCDVRLWLGKTIHDGHQPIYYHRGSAEDPPNWAIGELNAVLWKMLADHARHPLKVIVEGDSDYNPDSDATELGGVSDLDVSFTDYLRDWPGRSPGADNR